MASQTDFSGIKAAVERALFRNPLVDESVIAIEARDSEVALVGIVRTQAERDEAARVAQGAAASCAIRNELSIRVENEASRDVVYQAGVESFPASDPPSWIGSKL